MSFKELPFGNASLTRQNAFQKRSTKTELSNGESYIKNVYTKL